MSKPLFVISAPVDCYAGYGSRSRDLVKQIIDLDKYEVKVIPQKWGNTPHGYIKDHEEKWGFLSPHLFNPQQQNQVQPDIWMQITVPNEFQRVGKYNIGVTAGMETTLVDGSWVEGMNRMDLNLVSSEHSKKSFLNSVFKKMDKGRDLGTLKIEKPIEVLFEGADLDIWKPVDSNFDLESIKESFCFLTIGHWMENGIIGEDRKNIGLTIKSFLETFKNTPTPPALLLKISGAGSSIMDREHMLKKIAQVRKTVNGNLPNVYLLHGDLSESELNNLYSHPKVKAMVSLTKGEGFGRPLLEFSLHKKPIIASGWSGQLDFLKPEFVALLSGHLTKVHPSAVIPNMILAESEWFSPSLSDVGKKYKEIWKKHKNYLILSKRQGFHIKTNFSDTKMGELLDKYFTKYIPQIATENVLKLPKLKKIELPKREEKING